MLQIKQAHKIFGDQVVIDHLDLTIQDNQLVTLLGPSGCGKSTLLRCIAGLENLDSGTIELNGRDITRAKPQKRDVAMVFQNYALFPNMTVADNVAFGLRMKKIKGEERQQKVARILKLVELDAFATHKPTALSGGQKQRVAWHAA
ncbi:ABC transporter ATP-binding protein [Snodgrassella sp. CFCC 13594]|uniref:ABC transporter ATP-binding protein n=1 Tax=Snodgrassella sp. CFCC 13594 TaxID=1775559 RepID=UPI000AA33D42|nr:ABC transporter ATP-binding protein [Snodgrassella sp. CFCC 13594]